MRRLLASLLLALAAPKRRGAGRVGGDQAEVVAAVVGVRRGRQGPLGVRGEQRALADEGGFGRAAGFGAGREEGGGGSMKAVAEVAECDADASS